MGVADSLRGGGEPLSQQNSVFAPRKFLQQKRLALTEPLDS